MPDKSRVHVLYITTVCMARNFRGLKFSLFSRINHELQKIKINIKINSHVPSPPPRTRAHKMQLFDLSTFDLSSAALVSKNYGSSSILPSFGQV